MENKILTPNKRQLEWYKRRSAFIHFTVNTFTNKEWGDGTESPEIFNPSDLDCEQWIRDLRDAGFTNAILTAKHHDGFCLWPSKYTEHSVKNSPYKNGKGDIVKEFTDACRKYGIKPGLYLSPWDRNCKFWGTEEYNDYYAAQLTELMTNYGDIYECWWDGAGSTKACYDWKRWIDIVRENQENCVIYGSLGASDWVDVRWIGNELGKAAEDCYATIDVSSLETERPGELYRGKKDGNRFIPAECDTSIRPGWFYHKEQDYLVKSTVQLTNYWFNSVGRNCGILLNIPPDRSGRFCEKDVAILKQWNETINEIFKDNLLINSTLTSSVEGLQNPQNLFADDDSTVELEKKFVLEFAFDAPQKFNCFKIQEDIACGHRINSLNAEILVDGEWQPLLSGKSIGNCCARHFDTVTADALRITCDSDATPILKYVGVFYADESFFVESFEKSTEIVNLAKIESAQIIHNKNEIEIEFGGIFPFNTVIVNGERFPYFEIFAFNGSQYNSVYYGVDVKDREVCKFATIEGSYKIKLVAYDCDGFQENPDISVFLR